MMKTKLKKIFALFLAVILLASPALSPGKTALAEENPEEYEEIIITDEAGLLEFAEKCSLDTWSRNKKVILKADIFLSGGSFEPISTFGGIFDGGGHIISGLYIDGSVSPAGLFSQVQEGAVIQNLSVSGTVAPSGDGESVGGIAGENCGNIINCSFSGTVSGNKQTGGIAGINSASGLIEGCSANGAIFGDRMTGGIAGYNLGTVFSCDNWAYVNIASVDPSINLSDINLDLLLDSSKLSGVDTSTASSDTGGIAGYSTGILQYCVNRSTVGYQHIGYNVGGIAGRSSGYIFGCVNAADIYGRKDVGGIAGQIEPYISLDLSEDTLTKLQTQLDELNVLVNRALNHGYDGAGTVTSRLNTIADYMDSAADAASNIRTCGSIISSVSGSGESSASGGISVTPPQLEAGGSLEGGQAGGIGIDVSAGGSGLPDISDGPDAPGEGSGADFSEESALGETEAVPGGENPPETAPDSGDGSSDVTDDGENYSGIGGSASVIGGQGSYTEGEIHAGLTPGGAEGYGQSSVSGNLSVSTQIQLNTSLGGLSAAINGMSSQMRLLNGEMSGLSSTLTKDLKNINNKINEISNTVFEAMLGKDKEDFMDDTSDAEDDGTLRGKTISCENSGTVYGDINVGGIAGAMAIEYELDPEDDVSANISGTQRRSYEIKAVVSRCVNRGGIIAKRSCVGGIAGRMDLGLIADSENYGKIGSEAGDYVGGIAGITASTIRRSCVKCTLEGGRYVGGIVGSGTASGEEEEKSSSMVAQCYAMVRIPRCEQYAGAVSGADRGSFEENFFVEDGLAGINHRSYSGRAEPIEYRELFAVSVSEDGEEVPAHTVPDAFKSFTLSFEADGRVLKEVNFSYGDSFDESIFPEIPGKEGYYAFWDTSDLENLRFDTVVTVEYLPYETALYSEASRSGGQPVFFVEGNFCEDAGFTASAAAESPESFDVLPENFGDALAKCFTGTAVGKDVVEQWNLSFSDDGLSRHYIRYRSPDGDTGNLWIYVNSGDGWKKVSAEAVGSYLRFSVEGTEAEIAVISTMSTWWVWLIAGVLALAVLFALVFVLIKLTAARRKKSAAMAALPAAGGESSGAPALRYKRRRRWPIVLIAVLIVLAAAALCAYLLIPGLRTDIKAYNILRKYAEKDSRSMSLSLDIELDESEISGNAEIDTVAADGVEITRISRDGMSLYYAEGAVYFENGKGYRITEACPNYALLLSRAVELYRSAEISEDSLDGMNVFCLAADSSDAKALLSILAPDLEEYLPNSQTVSVTLYADGNEAKKLVFLAEGELRDSQNSVFSVSASLILRKKPSEEVLIPEAVTDAVKDGGELSGELSRELYSMAFALWETIHREPLFAEISVAADCGPIVLSDSLSLYRTVQDGLEISCVQKNGFSLYFTGDALCDKEGNLLEFENEDSALAARLPDIIYEICMNSEISCTESGGAVSYTAELDEKEMERVAHSIALSAENMDVSYDSGSITVLVENGAIKSASVSCRGSMKIMQSGAPVSLGAKLAFPESGENLAIPEKAYKALKESASSE
ncbi:MAG: hypothetical protein ACI4IW_00375 [Oscillospiraceae bacterium]